MIEVVDAKRRCTKPDSAWSSGIPWEKLAFPAEVELEMIVSSGTPVPLYWLDYCVLRQCQKDFDVRKVQDVIGQIGCTVVELDTDLGYLTRSFCIMEIYATVHESADLLCFSRGLVDKSAELYQADRIGTINTAAEKINAAAATTRDENDKRQIDDFIEKTVGFPELNRVVGAAIANGVAHSLAKGVFRS